MRPLSDSTDRNIADLWQLVSKRRWPWQRSAEEHAVSILRDIGESGEYLAITRIIAVCLDSRSGIANAAATAVAQLLDECSVRSLLELDDVGGNRRIEAPVLSTAAMTAAFLCMLTLSQHTTSLRRSFGASRVVTKRRKSFVFTPPLTVIMAEMPSAFSAAIIDT